MMHSHVTYVCGPCSYSQRSFALWGMVDREIVRLVICDPSIENRGAWLGSRKRRNFRKLTNASFPAQRGPQPTTSPSPSLSRPKPAFQPQTRCPGQTLPCSPNLVFQLQTRSEPKPAFQPEAGFPAVPTAQISLSRSKSCPPVENPVGRQSLLGWRESFLGWRAGFGLEGGCCRCPPSKQLV